MPNGCPPLRAHGFEASHTYMTCHVIKIPSNIIYLSKHIYNSFDLLVIILKAPDQEAQLARACTEVQSTHTKIFFAAKIFLELSYTPSTISQSDCKGAGTKVRHIKVNGKFLGKVPCLKLNHYIMSYKVADISLAAFGRKGKYC